MTRSLRHAERRDPAVVGRAIARARNRVGRGHGSIQARRGRHRPDRARPGTDHCVFAGAFRSWHGAAHLAAALARRHRAGDDRFSAPVHRQRPRASRDRAGRGRHARHHLHRRAPARGTAGGARRGRHRRRPVRHDAAPGAEARRSTGRRSRYSSTWRPGCRSSRRGSPASRSLVEHGREGWLYEPGDPAGPGGLDAALDALSDAPTRARMGAAARERAVRDFSWRGALRRPRRTAARPGARR